MHKISIEIFVRYKVSSLFYYNITFPEAKSKINLDLVSGFLEANALFFGEIGMGESNSLIRLIRGNNEIRMLLGERVHGVLLLRNLFNLDEKVYFELDNFLKNLTVRFELEYKNDITDLIERGRFKFKGIDDFILEEINKIQTHLFSSYLIQILNLGIQKRVKVHKLLEMILELDEIYSFPILDKDIYENIKSLNYIIKGKLQFLQKKHSTIENIIQKINIDNKEIARIFKIPMIHEFKNSNNEIMRPMDAS